MRDLDTRERSFRKQSSGKLTGEKSAFGSEFWEPFMAGKAQAGSIIRVISVGENKVAYQFVLIICNQGGAICPDRVPAALPAEQWPGKDIANILIRFPLQRIAAFLITSEI